MTELIKEVTPPKRPDLSNPYQTASPVGKVGTPPKSRITKKRVRATGKPTIPEMKTEQANEQDSTAAEKEGKVKEKVYSPQAIIEATVPKVVISFMFDMNASLYGLFRVVNARGRPLTSKQRRSLLMLNPLIRNLLGSGLRVLLLHHS